MERGLEVAEVLRRGEIPILEYRSLSKTNVIFDLSRRSYKLGDKKVMIRGDRKTSLKRLTSLLFFMRVMKERAEVGISTTKRDYYYLQKSRHPLLQPSSQAESDDIITMAEVHFNMNREIFGVIAQSKGYLYGDITLEEPRLTVNCLKTGGDGYSVPGNVEDIKIKEANIKLMLAIEKEGIYRNLMELGIPEDKILVARDGVDLQRFREETDKEKAREELGLPIDKQIVCYTGHLFPWKGVYSLAGSAKLLRQCLFLVVGGMDDDIRRFQDYLKAEDISNVEVVGYVQPSIVPDYLFAADVLVLPNSAKAKIASHYTSPLKLFEYMASRRPIVASDLPSLREVLRDGENAILVEPDDPKALAEGIQRVLDDPDLTRRISKQAYSEVKQYSWEGRAKTILEFINQGPSNKRL